MYITKPWPRSNPALPRTLAYEDDNADDLQFASMLSITLNLFGGILLMTKTQDEDVYGSAMMTGLLFGINFGMSVLFIYLTYMTLMGLGDQGRATIKGKLTSLVKDALLSQLSQVTDAIAESGIPEEQSQALISFVKNGVSKLVTALAGGELRVDYEGVYAIVMGGTMVSPMNKMIAVFKLSFGEDWLKQLLRPVTGCLVPAVD